MSAIHEFEDDWSRDVLRMVVGWILGTLLAIVLLLTVVRWAFLGAI